MSADGECKLKKIDMISKDEELVSEYANRLFEPSALYDIPYPVTIKCPECGCNDVRISAIKHEASKESDGTETSTDIVEFEGECSHRWHIEFASTGGQVYVGDSHCGDDIMIYATSHEEQPLTVKTTNEEKKEVALEGLGALFG